MQTLTRRTRTRLMWYYLFITEQSNDHALSGRRTITSAQIARALDVDNTLVRKDLASIHVRGLSRVGFDAAEVCRAIRKGLGFDQLYEAVLIGAGHLGGAMLAYPGFAQYGLSLVGAFDADKAKIGTRIGKHAIRSIETLKTFVERKHVPVAILTTPASASQSVAEIVVAAGIKAIWNFTPVNLILPEHVYVRREHISLGLADLAYYLKMAKTSGSHGSREPGDRLLSKTLNVVAE